MNAHKEYLTSTEQDAKAKALYRLHKAKKKRGGKYKMSERQFVEECEINWIAAELSATERMMRYIESDRSTLATVDDVLAEMHMFLVDLVNILKKKKELDKDIDFGLDDLLTGRYTTANVLGLNKGELSAPG